MGGVARPRRAARLGRPRAPGSSRSAGRCGPRATRIGFDSSHTAAGAVGSKGLQSRRDHDTVHPPGAGELEGRAHGGPRAAAVQAAGGRPRRAAGAGGRAPGLRRLGGSPLLHPAPISSPGRPARGLRARPRAPRLLQRQRSCQHRTGGGATPAPGPRRRRTQRDPWPQWADALPPHGGHVRQDRVACGALRRGIRDDGAGGIRAPHDGPRTPTRERTRLAPQPKLGGRGARS